MLSYGFYNSKGGDRKYDAEQIGAMFNGLIADGVFANYKEALRVTSGAGKREIVVRPGRAWFNGTWTEVDDGGHSIHLGTSFAVDDTFYICLAVSKKSRLNSIAYYKDIPENNPDTGLHYYLLAQINIPAGSDRIMDSMITDTRGSDLCPYVTGIMETVSFEELVKQVCGDSWQDWLGVYEAGITTGVQNAVRASSEALSEVKSLKAYSVESEAVSYTWAKFEAIATGGGGFEWATDSVHTELVDPPMPMCLFRDLSYADLGAGFKPSISLGSPYKPDGETTMKPVPASTQAKVWKEYPYFWEGGGAYGTEVLRYDDLQRVIVTSAGVATEKYRYRISRLVHLPVTYEPGAYMGTVTADNATAYPRDGYKDGYWYKRFAAKAEDVSFYYPGLSAKNVQDAIIEVARTGGTGGGSAMSVIEVEELPPTGISGVMYVVKKSGDSDAVEYLWLDRWEKVGGTESGSNNDIADMFGGYDRFYRSIARWRVNPEESLLIDTYDGSGQLTHPCVRHFPDGFAGHSWWMTASPYPNSALELENPCVWYSDDGIHWSADGIPNPLDEPLYVTGEPASMNSDPHLLVRPDGVMEVWWRTNYWENSGEGLYTVVYRRTSTDGVNWTAKEELHRMLTNSADGIVCPVALYEDGVYKIWAVSDQECLRYYESATGADWRHIRDIDVSNPDYPEYKVWHFDVNHTAKGYEFVGCYNIPGDYSSHKYLYYAVSQDNLTYSKRVMILTRGETGRFDERLVYRPTIVRLEDRVRIYYGANNADNVWSIGLIEAPSAYLFNAVLISGARVGAIESGQEWLDGRVTALEAQGGGGDSRPADEGVTVVRSFDESPWLPGYWDPNNDGALTLYSNMHRTQLVELASLTVDGELPEITATSSMAAWALVRFNYFDGNLRWIGADMGALIDPGAGTQEPTRLRWPAGAVYVAISANTADKSAVTVSGVPEGNTGSGQNGNYTLPVGGDELGGVKNGGSVIINQDGEMDIRDLVLDRRGLHLAETANAPAKLPIKTHPSGGDQPIHPKVLYLPNKFGGHYFWMGYTPYPDGSDGEENPCIACSDDMVNWYTPEGVTNPLDAGTKIAYMSDTHLVYNERTAMLELWYRHVDTTNGGSETIYRRRSANGSEWMEREKMHEHNGDISNIISPCILFEDGIYKIWASTGTPVGTLKYYETPDGRDWQLKAVTNLEGWHFDVIHTDIGYEAVIADTQPGATISYTVSPDGINWSDKTQILSAGVDGNWDDDRLYRASIVKQDGYYYLYYTGVTWPTWGIGLTVSTQRNDVFSIRGYISGAVLVREYGADYGSQIAALNAELRDLIAGLDARIAAIENARWEVVDIELTPATLSIKQDEQLLLTATLYPEGAPVSLIGWRSDDTAVAMVNNKGLVTGIAPGTCSITCYAKADESISASCAVTVAAQPNILRGVKLNNGLVDYETGATADSDTDVYTDLAPVEGSTLMRINFASPTYNQGDPYRAVFYDADGVFVGAAHGNDPSILATVPDGATQLRLGSHKAKLGEISIYGFDIITDYAESLKNQYYDSATGAITDGRNNNSIKVAVTAGREYRVVGAVSGCVLDANGAFVSGWPFDNARPAKTIVPAADGYICANYTYSNMPTIYEIGDRIGYLTVG